MRINIWIVLAILRLGFEFFLSSVNRVGIYGQPWHEVSPPLRLRPQRAVSSRAEALATLPLASMPVR